LGRTASTPVKRRGSGSWAGGGGGIASLFGGIFFFFWAETFGSAGLAGFFALGADFFFERDKKLLIISPATLLRDLATRTRTKSSLRIFDHPGIPISLARNPKSASVNELSSFEVAIVCDLVAKRLI
jgi:hypothetical protein